MITLRNKYRIYINSKDIKNGKDDGENHPFVLACKRKFKTNKVYMNTYCVVINGQPYDLWNKTNWDFRHAFTKNKPVKPFHMRIYKYV